MPAPIPTATILPPPGRPSWVGSEGLPLLYLGWGQRDFARAPLPVHYDFGTNFYLLLRGEVNLHTNLGQQVVRAPKAMIFDPAAAFGLTQARPGSVEILVWIWQGQAELPDLRPGHGKHLALALPRPALPSLVELHTRCRNEVARADPHLPRTLAALRGLMEVELQRAAHPASAADDDVRWNLASQWLANNLSIHAPVPALCDYLRMSAGTLHRFFRKRAGQSPGAYFRHLKIAEARRLIEKEGWQVKATAYHLGYRHPNDLSRAIAGHSPDTGKPDRAKP